MANLQMVLKDKNCIGFLLPCAKGCKAFSGDDGQSLGYFDNATDAAKAVYAEHEKAAPVAEGG